jgi:hypothetical protein
MSYIVGERGPELFTGGQPSVSHPRTWGLAVSQLQAMARCGDRELPLNDPTCRRLLPGVGTTGRGKGP